MKRLRGGTLNPIRMSNVRSGSRHIILRQRKADCLRNPAAIPSDLLKPLTNRRIIIPLTAFDTHPRWHTIYIDRLAPIVESGLNNPRFYVTVTEFAYIPARHVHNPIRATRDILSRLSRFFRVFRGPNVLRGPNIPRGPNALRRPKPLRAPTAYSANSCTNRRTPSGFCPKFTSKHT
jgi:hypothetical protein